MPGPESGQQHTDQQNGGLIYSPLNGHCFAGLYVTELGKRLVIKRWIAGSHLAITPLDLTSVITLFPIPSMIPFGYSCSRIFGIRNKKRLRKSLALCKCHERKMTGTDQFLLTRWTRMRPYMTTKGTGKGAEDPKITVPGGTKP
jgi:hypothetical protein